MKKIFLVVLVLCVSPNFASAKYVLVCKSRQAIDKNVSNCNDNEAYADAAVECLEKLQGLVKNATAETVKKLVKSTEKNMGDSAKSQNTSFVGQNENAGISKETTEDLIAAATQAKELVASYSKDIFMPEDFHLVEDLNLNIDEFLKKEPCYQENHEVLMNVGKDIDKIISDLKNAKTASEVLGTQSLVGKKKVDEVKPTATVKTGVGKGAPDAKANPAPRASDVSGIKEDQSQNKSLKK